MTGQSEDIESSQRSSLAELVVFVLSCFVFFVFQCVILYFLYYFVLYFSIL